MALRKSVAAKATKTPTKFLWEGVPIGALCWHIHHDQLVEIATEPLNVRAEFIRENKDANEIDTRLRLMRPVVDTHGVIARLELMRKYIAIGDTASAKHWGDMVMGIHNRECPDCPWDDENSEITFPDPDDEEDEEDEDCDDDD